MELTQWWQIALFLLVFFGGFGAFAAWLVRLSKRAEKDPKVAARVAALHARQEAKERATAEPYLPELETSEQARRFTAMAQRWGWASVRVEASPHRYEDRSVGGDMRAARTNAGPLAALIAEHADQPVQVRWIFEYDERDGWVSQDAELWVLDAPFGFEEIGLLQSHETDEPDDPEQLLSRLARGLPPSAWTECAAIFDDTHLYVDAGARDKAERCRRQAAATR